MAQGKQAKVLSDREIKDVLRHLDSTRYPLRDKVAFLLSIKAGLRVKEIALLTWGMVTDASGEIADSIALENRISKGKGGGRTIPVNRELRAALSALKASPTEKIGPDKPVLQSERGHGQLSTAGLTIWFGKLYQRVRLDGCSSHSGRRTFITRAARRIVEAGGSLRDVQQLAGHSNLGTTQRYIEGSTDAKRRLVELI